MGSTRDSPGESDSRGPALATRFSTGGFLCFLGFGNWSITGTGWSKDWPFASVGTDGSRGGQPIIATIPTKAAPAIARAAKANTGRAFDADASSGTSDFDRRRVCDVGASTGTSDFDRRRVCDASTGTSDFDRRRVCDAGASIGFAHFDMRFELYHNERSVRMRQWRERTKLGRCAEVWPAFSRG